MSYGLKVAPLVVPRRLADQHELDLSRDFLHRPVAATPRPEGGFYLLHSLAYNYRRYDPSDKRTLDSYLLSEYDENAEHLRTREIPWLAQRVHNEMLGTDGVTLETDSGHQRLDIWGPIRSVE